MYLLIALQFIVDYGERLVYKQTWLTLKQSVFMESQDEDFKKV